MKVLFDTNVILDVLLDREPFSTEASILLSKVEKSEIIGFSCATTITTIHYLTTKVLGSEAASKHIQSLLALFVIAPVNRVVLESAFAARFKDFEDAVLHEAAVHAGAQNIVTRNLSDFKKATLSVYDPSELLNALEILKNNG